MATVTYKKFLLLAALPALVLASCSRDEMTGDPGTDPTKYRPFNLNASSVNPLHIVRSRQTNDAFL